MTKRALIPAVELNAGDVAALDPSVLAPFAADAVDALLAEGESAYTVRSYRSALRYWAAWYWLRYRQPIDLRVAVAAIQQFVVDHIQRKTATGFEASLPTRRQGTPTSSVAADKCASSRGQKALRAPADTRP